MGKGCPGPLGCKWVKVDLNVRIAYIKCVLRRKGRIKKEEIKVEMFAKLEYTLNLIKFFIFL